MKKFDELLKNEMFSDCYDVGDVINKLNNANRSREIYFKRSNGIYAQDHIDAEIIKNENGWVYYKGKYTVEIGAVNYDVYDVIIEICAQLDEDGNIDCMSYKEIGWE